MDRFNLKFDLQPCDQLDQFALLACQDYNLANHGDWFGCFRGGLYGFYARIHGLIVHYDAIHAWRAVVRTLPETEFQLSSVFFNMDSALECLVYALNAFGYGVSPTEFKDVTDEASLRRIAPSNLISNEGRNRVSGWAHFFPRVQDYWLKSHGLIERVIEQHDVSKHRSTIYVGGQCRTDAPLGFFAALGLENAPNKEFLFAPMAEVFLLDRPKLPNVSRTPQRYSKDRTLETLAGDFVDFINRSVKLALQDAKETIVLSENRFRTAS